MGLALDAGDLRTACEAALRGYGPDLLAYLRALVRDAGDADELFSSVCEKLWRGLGTFRRECSFRTWVYKLAWHAAKDFRKAAARKRVRRLLTDEISKIAEEVRASTAVHHQTAVQDRMAKLRESLEPEEQSLLTLRLHAQLSWDEVADVMSSAQRSYDAAAVRKRYERLKARLRRMAESEGLLGARS